MDESMKGDRIGRAMKGIVLVLLVYFISVDAFQVGKGPDLAPKYKGLVRYDRTILQNGFPQTRIRPRGHLSLSGSSSDESPEKNLYDTTPDMISSETNDSVKEEAVDAEPNAIQSFLSKISIPNILAGSFIGATATLLALFIPFYIDTEYAPSTVKVSQNNHMSSIENIQRKASLFGDILYDLDTGYVDNVDKDRLFETAVTAMLKTLDPYTEYEDLAAAQSMQESVSGKYGGVGLVITNAKEPSLTYPDKKITSVPKSLQPKLSPLGVEVADAFEGYAYDAGLRIGDRIVSVNGIDTTSMNIEQVRNLLRGDPETFVTVKYERDMTPEKGQTNANSAPKTIVQEVSLKRSLVRLSDVRLATLLGKPEDGIGYINLSGFNAAVARDFRTAMLMLRYSSPNDLKGLILDLRGNPGGLLDAAVEIASYLVPPKSDIVSSKTKDGMEVIYRSSIDPIRPPGMKLVVLVNGASASASEVVSGAIQDLDAGLIIGPARTYGKGLVQKVTTLDDDAALKYTVARYYTPSGRCIQSIKYNGGRAASSSQTSSTDNANPSKDSTLPGPSSSLPKDLLSDGAEKISDSDRKIFYTASGRPVKDGGGIEPDIVIPSIKTGPAEGTLITQGIFGNFANDYLKSNNQLRQHIHDAVLKERRLRAADPRLAGVMSINSLSQYLVLDSQDSPVKYLKSQANLWDLVNSRDSMVVNDEQLYSRFKRFVEDLVKEDVIDLNYSPSGVGQQIASLEKSLKEEGYDAAAEEVEMLKQRLKSSLLSDMDRHKQDIVNDIELALLSREFPNRLLFYRNAMRDQQVQAAIDILKNKDIEFPKFKEPMEGFKLK